MNKATCLTIPPPEEIERRIAACRDELKALSRLLRMSRAARLAHEARAAREDGKQGKWLRAAPRGHGDA